MLQNKTFRVIPKKVYGSKLKNYIVLITIKNICSKETRVMLTKQGSTQLLKTK